MNRKSKRIESNMSKETGDAMIGSNVIDLFKSVRYHPSGDLDNEVSELLEAGGAKYCKYLCHLCTHCILGKSANDVEIEEAVNDHHIPAVSQDWVVGSVKCGKLLPTAAFSPSEDQLMSGVRVYISGVGGADARSIWAMVTFHGGRVDTLLTEATTHLVTTEDQGECFENAMARTDVFVVTPDWVSDSVRRKMKCIEMIYHPRLLVISPQMVNNGVEIGRKEETQIGSPQGIGECQLPLSHSNESSTEKEEQAAPVIKTPQQSILRSEAVADGSEERKIAQVQTNEAFDSLQDLVIPLDNYSNVSETKCQLPLCHSNESSREKGEQDAPVIKTPQQSILRSEAVADGFEERQLAQVQTNEAFDSLQDLVIPLDNYSNIANEKTATKIMVEASKEAVVNEKEPLIIEKKDDTSLKRSSGRKGRKRVSWCLDFSTSSGGKSPISSQPTNKKAKHKNKAKKEDFKIEDYTGGLKKIPPARCRRPKSTDTTKPLKEKAIEDSTKLKIVKTKSAVARRLAVTAVSSDSDTLAINIQTELQNQKKHSKSRKKYKNKAKKEDLKMEDFRGVLKNPLKKEKAKRDSTKLVRAKRQTTWTKVAMAKRGVAKNSDMSSVSSLDSQTINQQADLQNLQKQLSNSTENPITVDHNQNMKRTVRQHSNIQVISFNQSNQIKQVAESYCLPQLSISTSQTDSICASTKTLNCKEFVDTSHLSERKARDHPSPSSDTVTSNLHSISTSSMKHTGDFSSHTAQLAEGKLRGDYNSSSRGLRTARRGSLFTSPMSLTGNLSTHKSQKNKQAGDCDPPPLVSSRPPTILTSPVMPPSNARILTSKYPPHTQNSTFPRQNPRVSPLDMVMNQQELTPSQQIPLKYHQTFRNSQPAPLSNQQDSLPVTVGHFPAQIPPTSETNKTLSPLALDWTVEETIKGVSLLDPKLSYHVQIFRSHEIDGRALLMLDVEMMIKYLDMKVGPALKLSNIIEKLK